MTIRTSQHVAQTTASSTQLIARDTYNSFQMSGTQETETRESFLWLLSIQELFEFLKSYDLLNDLMQKNTMLNSILAGTTLIISWT